MNRAVRSTALAVLLFPGLALAQAQQGQAPAAPEQPSKEGLDYLLLFATSMNYSSIGPTDATAESYSAGLGLGTYITDHFKVELRAGGEFDDGKASYLPPGARAEDNPEDFRAYLDVSMPYFISWYIGGLYPWSDFSSVYGQFGFSYVRTEAETATPGRFEGIEGELYESDFSTSWLIGLDFKLIDSAYLLLEGGRLHTDTATDINTEQYTVGFRYEF
ncbi:outer membrane beta-barrel protein [Hydrocarboniclastica marina]|nr:outer membrane beta-barrel protein [Hydrocarboniclastica marina]|tara:strand:- start:4216 stop:4869 length:654 start_codon:yes stop_codon:yes gene_type:complete